MHKLIENEEKNSPKPDGFLTISFLRKKQYVLKAEMIAT